MTSLATLGRTTPTLPAEASPQQASFSASGFTISGLDIATINTASLTVTMPFRSGKFRMPTEFPADAKIKVQPGTTALINLELRRHQDKLLIDTAQLTFNPSLRIRNPASSLEPVKTGIGFINTIANELGDALSDFLLHSAYMDQEGTLHVDGTLTKPLCFPHESIDKHVGTIDRDVAKSSIKLPDFETANNLLTHLAKMLDASSFEMRVETLPTTIEIHGNGADLVSEAETISVNVRGTAGLNPDGSMHLRVDQSDVPEVTSASGTLEISGETELQLVDEDTFSGSGDIQFATHLSKIVGTIQPEEDLIVPINFTSPDSFDLVGSTGVSIRRNDVALKDGKFTSNLRNFVSTDPLRFASGTAQLTNGVVDGDIHGGFAFDGENIHLSNVASDVKVTGRDADIDLENLRLRIDGHIKANLDLHDGHLDSETGSSQVIGRFAYEMDPRSARTRDGIELGLLKREATFQLLPNGDLTINAGPSGLTEFFAPFFKIDGTLENIVSTESAPAGRVGSSELISHIAALTDSIITTNNEVELLIDGVQSYPKRMELIKNAKDSICLQTLIFKDDESGLATAQALIDAAKRGVKVRVIIDSLGNCANFADLIDDRPLYKMLKEGGVELSLYNDPATSGLASLIEAIKAVPELRDIKTPDDFTDAEKGLKILNRIIRVARGQTDAPEEVRQPVADALESLLKMSVGVNDEPIEISTGDFIEEGQGFYVAKLAAEMNHRWHEKYLIVDGTKAVLGGLNIADEYMYGGTQRTGSNLGIERPAWRDTDVFVQGGGAVESYKAFSKNWKHIRGVSLPAIPSAHVEAATGDTAVQVIQHRPRIDGDHHITNFMIENLKALQPGEKARFANAYFIPTGALVPFKKALIDAAKRGVDIKIVTNSATTTDAPQINQAAIFPYRDLLEAGVRIFERTGTRCMHSKVASFAGNTAAIGSWNTDNRSASLNSESLLVAYDKQLGKETEAMIEQDMAPEVAKEIKLSEIIALPFAEEVENSAVALLSDLM